GKVYKRHKRKPKRHKKPILLCLFVIFIVPFCGLLCFCLAKWVRVKMASKYVLVCQNVDCMQRGSGELFQKLKDKLAGSEDIEVKSYICFGGCQSGPNIVLYPQKVWYC